MFGKKGTGVIKKSMAKHPAGWKPKGWKPPKPIGKPTMEKLGIKKKKPRLGK